MPGRIIEINRWKQPERERERESLYGAWKQEEGRKEVSRIHLEEFVKKTDKNVGISTRWLLEWFKPNKGETFLSEAHTPGALRRRFFDN